MRHPFEDDSSRIFRQLTLWSREIELPKIQIVCKGSRRATLLEGRGGAGEGGGGRAHPVVQSTAIANFPHLPFEPRLPSSDRSYPSMRLIDTRRCKPISNIDRTSAGDFRTGFNSLEYS